jgi:ribosomal protein S18 acetylase RimI-like enzyme
MNSGFSPEHIRRILETDRIWSAYALADLDPEFSASSEWHLHIDSLILIYRGLNPPVLFAMGPLRDLETLFQEIPSRRYVYTLMGYCREMIRSQLKIEVENHMWRMVLKPDEFPGTTAEGVVKLGVPDLKVILELFADHHDRPDAFTSAQLEKGIFFGLFDGTELISIAGTHILSNWAGVAAIGNVFTRPDQRGRGFATRVTAAVVNESLKHGIKTNVLNVAMENAPALACYRKLGFWPYCGYYEGTAILTNK